MKFEPESSDLPHYEHQRETRNHSLWAQQQLVPETSSLLDFDGTSDDDEDEDRSFSFQNDWNESLTFLVAATERN